jgi:DegV family protein with EDD domain
MAIKLIIDSTSNLDKDYIEKHDIDVVSLSVVFDGVEIKEKDIENINEYYEKMAAGEYYLKTSQPGVLEFEEAMLKALDGGKNDVIVVTLSASLSGTNSCAHLAKNNIGSEKIHIIDSGQVMHGMGILVEEIIDMVGAGKSAKEIMEVAPSITEKIHLYCAPISLRFLKKGGRISKLSAIIGTVLQLKPVLHLHKGVVASAKKALGFSKALMDMASLIPQKVKRLVLVNAGGTENYFQIVKNAVLARGLKVDRVSTEASLVIVAHAGPGTVGAIFMTE